ncbi:hypothetical protein, variant [Blastomyces dermatitidis ER-3]|uniref:Uncharacterized protein n=1 Tax=Ajellomyces dermatitidis (strain ER-3 / ATCC MYA-2586) TaxID=559297 RepID=A0ABX2VYG7_AJEDR|nr:uncharacterized protein BDCG_06991 [Blastomyces dermatitidis ER-3]XP_045281921.1 hypothetical protein, variant [Blastomyces dermatitidis ER-3]OAT02193.1 hypothetical protein BDCG_06991 [Blastomyces dermatitidis ER-3]OAT02194.1 hypothetical protein, variant [Blastomyces dermatitidis ER-3]
MPLHNQYIAGIRFMGTYYGHWLRLPVGWSSLLTISLGIRKTVLLGNLSAHRKQRDLENKGTTGALATPYQTIWFPVVDITGYSELHLGIGFKAGDWKILPSRIMLPELYPRSPGIQPRPTTLENWRTG